MANKQISDLQARTFDGDSIIPHDVENTDPSTMSQKPYLTGSATGHAVADFIANEEEYTTALDTTNKTITGAINELNTGKADNDYIRIISQSTFPSVVTIQGTTEYNSTTPVAITGIPQGYKVVSITNIRCYGYYGSRVVGYVWLADDTHYHYSLFNPTSRNELTCQLDVSFLCVKQ